MVTANIIWQGVFLCHGELNSIILHVVISSHIICQLSNSHRIKPKPSLSVNINVNVISICDVCGLQFKASACKKYN